MPNKRGTPLPDKNINLLLLGWFCGFLFINPKLVANNWRRLWGVRKKPPHGAKFVGTCACATMAPNAPADNQMLGHDGVEDHGSDERGDSTRRASRLEKGKFVKQSVGIQPNEEPVTHKHFENLAHAILRAVGSRVLEAATSPITQNVPPPGGEKQIIPRSQKEVDQSTSRQVPVQSFKPATLGKNAPLLLVIPVAARVPNVNKKPMKIFDTS